MLFESPNQLFFKYIFKNINIFWRQLMILKKIKSFLIILSVQSFLFHNPVICCLFSSVCSVTIESEWSFSFNSEI